MKVKLSDTSCLICPNCGNEFLHQHSVSVFFRDAEDSKTGKFARCTSKQIATIDDEDNPSPRRDGLLVQFSCETCNADPELAIYQHQGETYVQWHTMRMPIKGEL